MALVLLMGTVGHSHEEAAFVRRLLPKISTKYSVRQIACVNWMCKQVLLTTSMVHHTNTVVIERFIGWHTRSKDLWSLWNKKVLARNS